MSNESLELHIIGPAGKKIFSLDQLPVRIGRSPDNDIPLIEDKVLSRQHLVVEWGEQGMSVRDLKSRHGTWTRGRRFQVHTIREGDVILAGRSRFIFLPEGSPTPPPPKRPPPGPKDSAARRGRRPAAPPRGEQTPDPNRPPRRPTSRRQRPPGPGKTERFNPQAVDDPNAATEDLGSFATHADEAVDQTADSTPTGAHPIVTPDMVPPPPAPAPQVQAAAPAPAAPVQAAAPAAPVAAVAPVAPVQPVQVVAEVGHGHGQKPRLPSGWPGGQALADPNNIAQQLLMQARGQGVSDVHVKGNLPITVREVGVLKRQGPVLSNEQVEAYINSICTPEQRQYFNHTGDFDFCYAFEGGGRYRTNICRHRTGNCITFRIIKPSIETLAELGIPTHIERLTTFAQGLVLITGPMGAGKTTTMFSLVQLVNSNRPDHIISVEDPIEFLIPSSLCQVSQRELGIHTESFNAALKAALREDPDIIVIGDLRDYETTDLSISASETGHLVFASMHAMSAMKSLDKLIDMFPAGEQNVVRGMVSESLRGIICQRLIPALAGGRVPAVEILFNSIAIANIIRENKMGNLYNAMQLGRSQGMQTLDMSLQNLVKDELISAEVAYANAENKNRFKHLLPPDHGQ